MVLIPWYFSSLNGCSTDRILRLDALFFGEYKLVAEERNPQPGRILYSFHERSPKTRGTEVERKRMRDHLKQMSTYVKYTLGSGFEDMDSGLATDSFFSYGATQPDRGHNYITINLHIAIDMLQPLMRDDLTDAERYGY